MHQLPGVSASGNKPANIGKTSVVKTTAWQAATSVTRLAYGGGYFFGGRGTNDFHYIKYPETGTVGTPSPAVQGQTNSAQSPSYVNGYFIQPTSSSIQYATDMLGTWTTKSLGANQVNKVIYVSTYDTWIAGTDNATIVVSTTGIGGTWSTRTMSPSISSTGSLDTDGSRVITGSKSGQMLYFEGNSTTANSITHPFGGTANFRTVRYNPENGVWTAGTTTGLIGYSATSNGASGWTLITPNFLSSATSDGDLLFVNNRWVAIATGNSGGYVVSISATSDITSTFSGQGLYSKATNGNDMQGASTDGNYVAFLSGAAFVYMR